MGNWDSYVMLEGDEEVIGFWNDPYCPQGKTLLIMGEGFDPRMNNVLKAFVDAKVDFECKTIVYGDYNKSPNAAMVQKNIDARNKLIESGAIPFSDHHLKTGAQRDLNRGVKFRPIAQFAGWNSSQRSIPTGVLRDSNVSGHISTVENAQ